MRIIPVSFAIARATRFIRQYNRSLNRYAHSPASIQSASRLYYNFHLSKLIYYNFHIYINTGFLPVSLSFILLPIFSKLIYYNFHIYINTGFLPVSLSFILLPIFSKLIYYNFHIFITTGFLPVNLSLILLLGYASPVLLSSN